MLTYIKIDGFKSFNNFEMEFTPFTVIAGANASGKSNLFDALKLLSRLAEADNLKKAFKEQRGEFSELFTQYSENDYADTMSFTVEMLVSNKIKDAWGNVGNIKYTRLRYELKIKRYTNSSGIEDLVVAEEKLENLKHQQDKWIKLIPRPFLENWRPKVETGKRALPYIQTITENGISTVQVHQDGTAGNKRRFPLNNASRTVLSSFDAVDFPHVLAVKEEMRNWKFLELNPEDLRQPTSKNSGEDILTQSGKNLAAVLYRIKQDDEYSIMEISRKLQTFLPSFIEVDVVDDTENKQYVINIKDKDKKNYTSRVLSEGTLRILALCILEYDNKHTSLLCFEEPENGVHPLRIGSMAKLLKDLSLDFSDKDAPLRQVIVNTHSPVLVDQIYKWQDDKNVSIWYAEMVNRVDEINHKRIALSVTSILPVKKENSIPFQLNLSEQDKKLTLSNVTKYLETAPNTY
ncbi:AAA family ATPase [Emticicia sp. TH156]|uniref:AAA family ATPase n=1 Tax=Emticicia sp. TH156 TaxID=2067454 RepID=UPI000C788BD4|nr:AAA family ATPase [Emticicia sp. TH156]PLK44450.1 ATPase [Emticicia sp. TH156]